MLLHEVEAAFIFAAFSTLHRQVGLSTASDRFIQSAHQRMTAPRPAAGACLRSVWDARGRGLRGGGLGGGGEANYVLLSHDDILPVCRCGQAGDVVSAPSPAACTSHAHKRYFALLAYQNKTKQTNRVLFAFETIN
jgi:hypothetical protein